MALVHRSARRATAVTAPAPAAARDTSASTNPAPQLAPPPPSLFTGALRTAQPSTPRTPRPAALTAARGEAAYAALDERARRERLLQQEAASLRAAGLLIDGEESQLCGPTALLNLFELRRAARGMPPIEDKAALLAEAAAELAAERIFISAGMFTWDLARFAELLGERLGDRVETSFADPRMADSTVDLDALFDPKRNEVVSLSFYQDGKAEVVPRHFVLRVGVDPAAQTVTLSDPFRPEHPVVCDVVLATTPYGEALPQLQPRSVDAFAGFPAGPIFVEGLVKLRSSPDTRRRARDAEG